MPKYRDKVTGQVVEFDHEPSQQEVEQRFNLPRGSGEPMFGGPTAEESKSPVAPGLGGLIGGVVGGKVGGPVGAGLGAAAGTGVGDIYNMLTHGVGDTTPGSEAQRLAEVGGLTAVGEKVGPAILRAPKQLMDRMGLSNKVAGLAALFGHTVPAVGKIGAEVASAAGDGLDWLRTPFTGAGGEAAGAEAAAPAPHLNRDVKVPAGYFTQEQLAQRIGQGAAPAAAPQKPGLGRSILDGLSEGWNSAKPAPQIPSAAAEPVAAPKPRLSSEVPYSISEDMLPDYSHVKAPSGGQEGMVYPNMTREPNLKYGADVSAAPMKTPKVTQTAPTDPSMPWEEHMSRSNPKRTATGGNDYSTVQVGTPEESALQGLQSQGPEGFGKNTVGAAERTPYLPKTVDEAKGLSLDEQDQWEAYKQANPAVTDSMLNSWYTSKQLGGNPYEHLDISGKIDALMNILKKP